MLYRVLHTFFSSGRNVWRRSSALLASDSAKTLEPGLQTPILLERGSSGKVRDAYPTAVLSLLTMAGWAGALAETWHGEPEMLSRVE